MSTSNRLAAAGLLAAAFAQVAAPAVANARSYALARVAAQLGYTYAYLGSDDAVTLTRPGLTVLVRPGERLFDVNDRSEVVDRGDAPKFSQNDVYVSPQFVRRLAALASRAGGGARDAGLSGPPLVQPAVGPGPIVLDVKPVPGSQLLRVTGHAPAGAPITLTLRATFALEVPETVLNRSGVSADDQGNFSTTVPLAPGYFNGAYVTLEATSLPGVTKASQRLLVPPPNAGLKIPADEDQRSIR